MKASIKDGNLTIDMEELVASLTDEERRRFAQYAVFSDTLLQAVVETVVKGQCFDEWWYVTGLSEKLRTALLPLLPEAFADLVKKLIESRNQMADANQKYYLALASILDHWPDASPKPDVERYPYEHGEYRPMNQAEVEAWIVSQLPPGEWEAIKAKCVEKPAETAVAN